jgi:adenylate cyclase
MGEAMANISTGFAFQSKNGEVWASSDLDRVQGDLLAANGSAAESAASYRRAMVTARQAGARTFELRAAVRLWRVERSAETRAAVDRLYGEFTEGLESADLREARTATISTERL